MDMEKLIAEITEEVYKKLSSDTSFAAASASGLPNQPPYLKKKLSKYVDHTLLKPAADEGQIRKLCETAVKYDFASVCVNPGYVPLVKELLRNSGVNTCCVIGFPLGATTTEAKCRETADAIHNGADEVDMVINVGAIKSNNWALVKSDIEGVCMVARGKALVKVIIETGLLTDEEKVKACTASKLAGAQFVKTCTGFGTGVATVEDVRLMRKAVGPDMGVKASSGIRSYKDALAMIEAGADRLGTSAGPKIIDEAMGKPAADDHVCINCGACKKQCPTGNATIICTKY